MKNKKHLFIVSLLAVMLSLAGCGKEDKQGFEYNEAELTLKTMTLFDKYSDVDDEYVDYYLSAGTEFEKSAVKGIDQARNNDKVGEFEDYKKYLLNYNKETMNPEEVEAEFTEADGAVTVTIINKAKDKDVEISVKYTENSEYFIAYSEKTAEINEELLTQYITDYLNSTVEEVLKTYGFETMEELVEEEINSALASENIQRYVPEEMVVSAVYSKGELLKQAGMNTLIGMGTVFVVLIFISFIISLFKFLPALTAKKAKVPEPKKVEVAPKNDNVAKTPAKSIPANENLMNDAELVAVITAAIYAATGSAGSVASSKDKLVVRSIKRVKK